LFDELVEVGEGDMKMPGKLPSPVAFSYIGHTDEEKTILHGA
jgi:hypothetical protein